MRSAFPRQVRTGVAAFAVLAALSTAAACGSDNSSTGSSTDKSGGADGAAAVPSEVSATVDQFRGEAQLGLKPLSAKPATGKHVIFLANAAAPTTVTTGGFFLEAAKTLGWTGKMENYAGDPASLATAVDQAVSEKPDGIVISGADPSSFSNALKKAGAAGVPVFVGGAPAKPTGMDQGGLSGLSLGEQYLLAEGKTSADWVLKDSGAKANVAIVTLAGFPTLQVEEKGFTDELKSVCPSCKTKTVETQLTDIGKALPGTVVSTLQTEPDINYVYFPYGDMSVGVPAALKAANLSPKLVTAIASDNTYADLKSGKAVMTLSTASEIQGWLEADLVARYYDTKAPVLDDVTPFRIYDKTNDQADKLPVSPSDYQDQFKKLWLLAN
ncbi:substrate-binding domain-containing protein [Nocardioides sp. BP30]|uniref:sugar ABC transporter substrate-binding protein n=1 Tax=Nocardioides sp. BP30 TaxID=3036374 RepID=UPI0024686AB4|nr:substrate-binding domain-containing protein [Nocardioides sp. BP30]WGL54150.1 substrate-binding domain-containing protein [Nocardioides sp. BP30]